MKTSRLTILSCCFLLTLLPRVATSNEGEDGSGISLARQIRPADSELLEKADQLAKASMAASEKVVTSAEGRAAIREMKALLSAKRLPIKDAAKLHGAWKVRSLQAGKLGAFSYPFFDCRIIPEAKALVLHKAKGSQRRFGFLERDSEDRFLFAGAMYFTYDPNPRMYRGVSEKATEEDLERNCVAWLHKIGEQRMIMVFPGTDGELELYELKR